MDDDKPSNAKPGCSEDRLAAAYRVWRDGHTRAATAIAERVAREARAAGQGEQTSAAGEEDPGSAKDTTTNAK